MDYFDSPAINKQELTVSITNPQLRWYQLAVTNALEQEGIKRFILVWSRRAGKDVLWFHLAIIQCLMKPVMILYCLPTFQMARRVIWDALFTDGTKFLSLIPMQTVANINNSEMKITFKNGSILSMVGALTYDNSIVGSNCYGVIFSEAGQIDNLIEIYEYLRPILAQNNGWVAFQSTPRGRNDFYNLWLGAQNNPKWFASSLNAYETKHISHEVLEEEKKEMSEDKFLQEYMVDFNRGQESLIFGKYIDKMHHEERFTIVNYDPTALTYVCFDLGWQDSTALIWFQVVGDPKRPARINIIDFYMDNHLGLDFYVNLILKKPYRRGTVFGPHDMAVHEIGNGGRSRLHMAQDMGLDMHILDQQPVEDSLEQCFLAFPKVWIDSRNCKRLYDVLGAYRRKWVEDKKKYDGIVHDWASDGSDAFRYMCQAVNLLGPSLDEDDFERKRHEAYYGNRVGNFGPFVKNRRQY